MNAVKYLRAAFELKRIQNPCNSSRQFADQQLSERSINTVTSQGLGDSRGKLVNYGLVQSHPYKLYYDNNASASS